MSSSKQSSMMETKQKTTGKIPDLRWPNPKDGVPVGIGILLFMSIVMFLLLLYKSGTSNPWLVIIHKDGEALSPEYLTSIFTAPFFHSNLKHLWPNLVGLWGCGILAFAVAGYQRACFAILWGIVLAGLMLVITGDDGAHYFGSTPIIFAFVGIIIQAAIRRGIIVILCAMIIISLVDKMIIANLQGALGEASVNKLWLANFFGFVGGLMADLKNPTEAVRILYKNALISDQQTEHLLRKCEPELYEDPLPSDASRIPKPTVPSVKQAQGETTEQSPTPRLSAPSVRPERESAHIPSNNQQLTADKKTTN